MKSIIDTINEAKLSFDIRSDVWNALEELANMYERKGHKFDRQEVESALDWFAMEFFDE